MRCLIRRGRQRSKGVDQNNPDRMISFAIWRFIVTRPLSAVAVENVGLCPFKCDIGPPLVFFYEVGVTLWLQGRLCGSNFFTSVRALSHTFRSADFSLNQLSF